MLGLVIVSFSMFSLVIVHLIVRHIRGYGVYGKYYEENHAKIPAWIGNFGIIMLFLFTCFLLIFEESAREELVESLKKIFE